MKVKLILPALTEATSPLFRPIKYSLFPPLGRLIGEREFGPVSQALIAAWEGGLFGFGVGIALIRRRSHADLTNPSSAAQDLPGA